MKITYLAQKDLPKINGRIAILGAGDFGHSLYEHYQQPGCQTSLHDDYFKPGEKSNNITLSSSRQLKDDLVEHVFLATLKARQRMLLSISHLELDADIYLFEGDDDDIFAQYDFHYNGEIAALRNIHQGEPAFIVGNGPSLNDTDPRLIKKGITFAANAIYLMHTFEPNYYFCDDTYVAEQRKDEINALKWKKFFPVDQQRFLDNGTFYNGKRVPWINNFSEDFADYIELNASVSFTMIQMAFHMGCNPVYLIGMDHSYQNLLDSSTQVGNTMVSNTADHSHFHKDYFAAGTKWHYPWIERMDHAFELSLEHFKKNKRDIYNATCGGNLEVFPRIDYSRLIANNS
jgi:hypothetical protein